ncbi:MAG TPA: YggS family pyridoxal phosphate-dependent enzyme [Thermoanaerobaculia bacterium]|nr:YggS family pyridoxal phosphate-dependent enzyme [Thermoanaerobaculia bacterium]
MTRADEIAANVALVRERISRAAERAGRDPAGVLLVAVTKTKPLEDAHAAYAAGIRAFGENRVQEAEAKFPSLPADAERHLIGPIQSNKANRAARIAAVVQTVDSADIARRLARAAETAGKRLRVFLEIRLGGETTKAGVDPPEAAALAGEVRNLPALELAGLMTIPPPGDTRIHFRTLRRLASELGLTELSMGMSDDFEAAVEEGATLVRIGTALFGSR